MTVDTEPQTEEPVVNQVVEKMDQALESSTQVEQENEPEIVEEETRVPLSALQKERKKRQDAEARSNRFEVESQFYKEQTTKAQVPEEEDYSLSESATKAELNASRQQTKQEVLQQLRQEQQDEREKEWVTKNPERFEYVTQNLEQFLQTRPNLTQAVQSSKNRYKEAYELMSALSPRQQKNMTQPVKKAAPGSPSSIPKAANINQTVDVMAMNDDEYLKWRSSKRKR